MRKFIPLLICCLLYSQAQAQYVNIPDTSFRNYLIAKFPACFNASKQMDTTCSAVIAEDSLNVDNKNNIVSVDGIRYFDNLIWFSCRNNKIKILSQLPNTLKYLICDYNPLTGFTNLPASLKELHCFADSLQTLPSLPAGLTNLDCRDNKLNTLPSLPSTLATLYCSYNLLTSIPPLPSGLLYLHCYNNLIPSLPALPSGIKELMCQNNKITTLPALPNGINYVNCSYNNITSITNFPTTYISSFDCSHNQLSFLPSPMPVFSNFYCNDNQITTIPSLLASGFNNFDCSNNLLTALPAFNTNLFNKATLRCDNNKITNITNLTGEISYLYCSNNLLTTLPKLKSVEYLDCSHNKITSITDSAGSGLEAFICSYNLITSITVLQKTLTKLDCDSNQLTALPDLSGITKLRWLYCNNNKIATLPNLPNSLDDIRCDYNKLTSIPSIPPITSSFTCSGNRLTSLPNFPNTLSILHCRYNPDLECLPKLPNGLKIIYTAGTKIKCLPNFPPSLINGSSYTKCNPALNANQCTAYPEVRGNIYYDTNVDSIKNGQESGARNIKVKTNDSNYVFSDKLGNYYFVADTIGTVTLTPVLPALFKTAPSKKVFNLANYDTILNNQNFAVQPLYSKDSVVVTIAGVARARRGRPFFYQVDYQNAGSTNLSDLTLAFNYDSSLLTYDSASNSSFTHTGNSLVLTPFTCNFGESKSVRFFFTVKTTANLGSSICSNASFGNSIVVVYDTNCNVIIGAYDPNDKQATPQLSTQQVADGKMIDYTIRFQNTGNDTAFNVVIADTLSSKLQAASMQMVATSHICRTTVKDNIIYFEMRNIMLPDSNVDKLGCNGFIRFKVKPQPTLVAGDIIPNKASIYFDYNTPIKTNTTQTIISNTLPITLLSFSAIPKAEENKVMVYWNTANEINTSFFIIEQSADGRSFKPIAEVAAKGSGNNSYYYSIAKNNIVYLRLKMVDRNGVYTYSNVIFINTKTNNTDAFTIADNPVKTKLQLLITDNSLINTQASIVNSNGIIVKKFNIISALQNVNVGELANGTYYLQTTIGSKKIIIAK